MPPPRGDRDRGPVTESPYPLTAASLADVETATSGRDEAGQVSWTPTHSLSHSGGKVTAVTVAEEGGAAVFAAAKASIDTKSSAYDTRTRHGLATGTVLDAGIEQLEEEERAKAESEGESGTGSSAP